MSWDCRSEKKSSERFSMTQQASFTNSQQTEPAGTKPLIHSSLTPDIAKSAFLIYTSPSSQFPNSFFFTLTSTAKTSLRLFCLPCPVGVSCISFQPSATLAQDKFLLGIDCVRLIFADALIRRRLLLSKYFDTVILWVQKSCESQLASCTSQSECQKKKKMNELLSQQASHFARH